MSDQTLAVTSLPPSAPATPAGPAPASRAAARTKLLLEGPILPTLLRLAAPNVLTEHRRLAGRDDYHNSNAKSELIL